MIAALALLAAAAPAAPDAPPPAWQGVWRGTVGGAPVRACLARRGDAFSVGSYYYLRRLRPIPLGQAGRSKVWTEGQDTGTGPERPRWTFDGVGAGLMTGVWSQGSRRLPFRLERVAGSAAEDDEPCGGALFNGPRLRPLRVAEARATKDGVGYRLLRFDAGPAFEEVELRSFALDGDGAAVRRVNAALTSLMRGDPARSPWFECVAGNLASHGLDGDYSAVVAPTMIGRRWLAAEAAVGGYCGGAHPSVGVTSLTFDLASGAAVALDGWLNDRAVERHAAGGSSPGYWTVRPALRAALLARWRPGEPECRDVAADAEFWDVGLTRAGLRFTPSLAHVVQACAEPVALRWDALAPFLSAAGKAGSASVRAEAGGGG